MAIKKLNPSARIIESSFCKIDPKDILNTGLFNFEEAEQSAGWIEELNKAENTPETDEYGISSFVFEFAHKFSFLYGVFSAIIAIALGITAGFIFKKN